MIDAFSSAFGLLASSGAFERPPIDWHAVAPELCLLGGGALLTLIDVIWLEKGRSITSALAGIVMLIPIIPILTLAIDSEDRSMFKGAFVVDKYSLIIKALFLLSGYLVVLLSTNYIAEGEYWENEYYGMLISSVLGMVLMASARDLITIFVALELLSIPAYLLAAWRKKDHKSNEAGMSLIFGVSGSTILEEINESISGGGANTPVITLGITFVIIGFGFKVSAFPFHTWAPDTYEGAPTPVTAFLAVASKAAGFVALMNLVVIGFIGQEDVFQPLIWILAALSMTAGNVMALRQTNIVRLMAYSGIAQAGFMLAPLAVAGEGPAIADKAVSAVVTYLVIYAAMNIGAFGIILAVSRKTKTADLESYNGLFRTSPSLAIVMTVFLASLAGIPPLGGWYAKFSVFTSLTSAGTNWGYGLAVVAAINAVIAFGYYGKIALRMWVEDPHEAHEGEVKVPVSLLAALVLTAGATIAFGVAPGIVTHFTDVSLIAFGG